jgi:hypothetical protein
MKEKTKVKPSWLTLRAFVLLAPAGSTLDYELPFRPWTGQWRWEGHCRDTAHPARLSVLFFLMFVVLGIELRPHTS